jgi:hypothetical protein
MMQTYDGAAVMDAQGEPVRTLECSYLNGSGTLRLARP